MAYQVTEFKIIELFLILCPTGNIGQANLAWSQNGRIPPQVLDHALAPVLFNQVLGDERRRPRQATCRCRLGRIAGATELAWDGRGALCCRGQLLLVRLGRLRKALGRQVVEGGGALGCSTIAHVVNRSLCCFTYRPGTRIA